MIQRLYDMGLTSTHQLSKTATCEGSPLDLIAQGQKLKAYPGAINEGFIITGDGQQGIEKMQRQLT